MTIDVNLTYIFVVILIGIVAFLIHSGFNINIFLKKEEHIAEKFLDKFPLVAPEFIKKGIREQNIENNQEIHEINKRFDEIEGSIKGLEEALKKAINVIEELQKRG